MLAQYPDGMSCPSSKASMFVDSGVSRGQTCSDLLAYRLSRCLVCLTAFSPVLIFISFPTLRLAYLTVLTPIYVAAECRRDFLIYPYWEVFLSIFLCISVNT